MQAKLKSLISELTNNKEKTMKFMRMTLVLLVFALVATTTSFGQNAGWTVERDQTLQKMIMGGNNQQVGKLVFRRVATDDEAVIEEAGDRR